MKISHELKMEIITRGKVDITQQCNEVDVFGRTTIIPSYKEITFFLNLNNNLALLKECERWFRIIMDDSCTKMKINVWRFMGLFPIEIDIITGLVTFTADDYNSDNENWKDWFVVEEQ